MDPTANLLEQLALATTIRAAYDNGQDVDNDAVRLAELVEALHNWIRNGGFLPAQWRKDA